jgi:hypothetical protein
VLGINILYGLVLVVVHAGLLAESPASTEAKRTSRGYDNWFFQLCDLDLSFGHETLGLDDSSCLMFGMLYGIVLTVMSGGMLFYVTSKHRDTATAAQWFVAFLHLELVVYIGVVTAQVPQLCKMQHEYMPHLAMQCEVLKYSFLERGLLRVVFAGASTWVFSSFWYILSQHNSGQPQPQTQTNEYEMRPSPTAQFTRSSSHLGTPQPMYNPHPAGAPGGGVVRNAFPRNQTSIASSASAMSRASESQPLIKPPVAIH